MNEFDELLEAAREFIRNHPGVRHMHAVDTMSPQGVVVPAETQYTGDLIPYWNWRDPHRARAVQYFVDMTPDAYDILRERYHDRADTDAARLALFNADVWSEGLTTSARGLDRRRFSGALRSSLHF